MTDQWWTVFLLASVAFAFGVGILAGWLARRDHDESQRFLVLADPEVIDRLAEVAHDTYERAATAAGWETQERSRKPWSEVPEANKATTRAAVRAIVLEVWDLR